jgi:hypothetical protein
MFLDDGVTVYNVVHDVGCRGQPGHDTGQVQVPGRSHPVNEVELVATAGVCGQRASLYDGLTTLGISWVESREEVGDEAL